MKQSWSAILMILEPPKPPKYNLQVGYERRTSVEFDVVKNHWCKRPSVQKHIFVPPEFGSSQISLITTEEEAGLAESTPFFFESHIRNISERPSHPPSRIIVEIDPALWLLKRAVVLQKIEWASITKMSQSYSVSRKQPLSFPIWLGNAKPNMIAIVGEHQIRARWS